MKESLKPPEKRKEENWKSYPLQSPPFPSSENLSNSITKPEKPHPLIKGAAALSLLAKETKA